MPKKNTQLGKSIIKARFGQHQRREGDPTLFSTYTEEQTGLRSITQENDLDAFLRTAEMAGTDFTAERLNIQIIPKDTNVWTKEDEQKALQKIEENKERLTIPRRPQWDSTTTPEQLDQNERSAFLEWRRQLAYLEEDLEMVVTPFERNLEVWRQLWRVVERSDLLVQIVDARDPLFYRSKDLEKYVKENGEKGNMLLLNKADFLTDKQRKAWAEYFEREGTRFAFFSAKKSQEKLDEEAEKSGTDDDEADEVVARREFHAEDVLSPTELVDLFYAMKPQNKQHFTVGLIGYPNVGKSSSINAILGEKKVTVSSTPGKTKHFQTLKIASDLTLCDCPGLVFPSFATTKAEMVVKGVLPIDQLRDAIPPTQLVCNRIPKYFMEWFYGFDIKSEGEQLYASELLSAYAVARGFRRAGQGNPDESRAARYVLKDYVNGELLFCHPPPGAAADYERDIYEPGGIMYEMSRKARVREEKAQAKPQPSKIDQEMNDMVAHDVQARTNGRKGTVGFQRVTAFPHQSGYSLDEAGKKHKNKKRVKDRSWRA